MKVFKYKFSQIIAKGTIMVNNMGSKNICSRGSLMKNMKSHLIVVLRSPQACDNKKCP